MDADTKKKKGRRTETDGKDDGHRQAERSEDGQRDIKEDLQTVTNRERKETDKQRDGTDKQSKRKTGTYTQRKEDGHRDRKEDKRGGGGVKGTNREEEKTVTDKATGK